MVFRAHDYQKYCIDYLLDRDHAGLFLDMGLGKTAITLTAIDELINNRYEVNKALVIAPLRVAEDTWSRESEKWDHLKHLRISKILGSSNKRIDALKADADIYCMNRENTVWLIDHLQRTGQPWPFDLVVIDELSSFKNPSAKRFKALRKQLPLIKRLWGLTGTPAPNGLIDLWSQMYLLDRGVRLGRTLTEYRNHYFRPGKGSGFVVYEWIPRRDAEDEIYNRISDICVSMRAHEYLTLPERVDVKYPVKLNAAAQKKYTQMEKQAVLVLGPKAVIDATSAAVLSGKLLQMANGAVYDDEGTAHEIHDAKLDALEDLIEAANGQPVLVFFAYQHDYERIKKRFPEVIKLESSKDIKRWNRGEIPVLVAHPAAAGHGLNLQEGGHHIIWFGLTWSLELYQQANARIFRQGQSKAVTVTHIIAEGTIDEDVMKVLSGKANKQEALLEAVKARLEKYRL